MLPEYTKALLRNVNVSRLKTLAARLETIICKYNEDMKAISNYERALFECKLTTIDEIARDKLLSLQDQQDVGWIKMDFKPIKQVFATNASKWLWTFTKYLMDQTIWDTKLNIQKGIQSREQRCSSCYQQLLVSTVTDDAAKLFHSLVTTLWPDVNIPTTTSVSENDTNGTSSFVPANNERIKMPDSVQLF